MRRKDSDQEDYILRMIQEVGRAIARIREMLLGRSVAATVVRSEIEQASTLLLGADRPMLERLDAESAVRIVGSAARSELWAQLLEVTADSWRQSGDLERATALRERAFAVREAASRLFP